MFFEDRDDISDHLLSQVFDMYNDICCKPNFNLGVDDWLAPDASPTLKTPASRFAQLSTSTDLQSILSDTECTNTQWAMKIFEE